MTKNILRTVILAFLIMSFSPVFSQENQEKNPKYALTVHPFALLWGGIKCNFNMKIHNRQWLVFMPTVYLYSGIQSLDWNLHDYDGKRYRVNSSKGFGLEVNYKYYLHSKEIFYVLGGLSNSVARVQYSHYDYIPFVDEDELTFYRYDKITEKSGIFDKLGVSVCVGANTNMKHGFFADFYLGAGYLHSFYSKNKIGAVSNGYIYDFRYRGFYPAFGVSVGYAWGASARKIANPH